jgi:AsmA protein
LQHFSLTNAGSGTPILQASGATIVVPWRALLHGEVAIERIEIDAPRIDLGELRSLLARLPRRKGPPRLPTIATGIHVSQGTLTNGGTPLLFELGLDTGELVPGRPFQLDASARSAAGRKMTASLVTVPSSPRDGSIDFDPVHVDFGNQDGVTLQLAGQGHWRGGESLALQLGGTLRYPALAPSSGASAGQANPGTSATAAPKQEQATATDKVALAVVPASGKQPLTITVKLDGDNARADLHLQPTEFGAWWQRVLAASPDRPPGPLPATGTVAADSLDLGWMKAGDLRIEAGPDLAPASSASTAPASAVSSAH